MVNQGDNTVYMYTHQTGAPRFIRNVLLDLNTEIVDPLTLGNENSQLSPIGWSSEKFRRINPLIASNRLNRHLQDNPPNTEEEGTFCPSAQGTFSKIDHTLWHNPNLYQLKNL